MQTIKQLLMGDDGPGGLQEIYNELRNESGGFRTIFRSALSAETEDQRLRNLGAILGRLINGELTSWAQREESGLGGGTVSELERFGYNNDERFTSSDVEAVGAFFNRIEELAPDVFQILRRYAASPRALANDAAAPADPLAIGATGLPAAVYGLGGPGIVPGQDPPMALSTEIDPNGPGDNVDPTIDTLLHEIASGMGTTVTTVIAIVRLILILTGNGSSPSITRLMASGALARRVPVQTFTRLFRSKYGI